MFIVSPSRKAMLWVSPFFDLELRNFHWEQLNPNNAILQLNISYLTPKMADNIADTLSSNRTWADIVCYVEIQANDVQACKVILFSLLLAQLLTHASNRTSMPPSFPLGSLLPRSCLLDNGTLPIPLVSLAPLSKLNLDIGMKSTLWSAWLMKLWLPIFRSVWSLSMRYVIFVSKCLAWPHEGNLLIDEWDHRSSWRLRDTVVKREVLRNLRQMVAITCCLRTRKAIGSLFMRRVASKCYLEGRD